MITVLVISVICIGVFLINGFYLQNTLSTSIWNTLVMLGVCVMFSLPVGEWETRQVEDASVTSDMIFVTPCDRHTEDGSPTAYITPVYTNLLEMCLSDDEHVIQYNPDCCTRKEAIRMYIAQR